MKSVISYFSVLFSALFYMLFFDSRSGAVMLFFLLSAIIISVAVTVNVRKHVKCTLTVPTESLKKNNSTRLFIHAVKDTVLPVPVLTVTVSASGGIDTLKYSQYRFSMAEKKSLDIDLDIIPFVSGTSEIRIEKAEISDYLGIFKFRIKNFKPVSENVFVTPNIPEMENNSELLKMICDSVEESDDDFAETSSVLPGLPGYEYREYIPGDSLRKVNWKMSSKKRKLYVRLDEAAGVSIPNIILDNTLMADIPETVDELILRDRITESTLAVMNACIRSGISCTFSSIKSGALVSHEVVSGEDVEKIADQLSHMEFERGSVEVQTQEKKKTSSMNIIFAVRFNDNNSLFAESAVSSGNSVRFVIPDTSASDEISGSDIWLLKDDFSIVRSSL